MFGKRLDDDVCVMNEMNEIGEIFDGIEYHKIQHFKT